MKKRIKDYFFEAVVFLILLFVVSSIVSYYRYSQMNMDDSICKDGARIVYFWGSWCPVCKMESPNIDRIAKHFKVESFAVKSGDVKSVESYMQNAGYDFPYNVDERGEIAHKYGVNVFPTLVFCKDGRPFLVESGYVTTLGIAIRAWISGL